MYHLRLKSQRCSCAQVHHYYLAINFSVQFTFALQHRNATDSSQRVTAVAMLFGDNVRSKFTHSRNVQLAPRFRPMRRKYVEIQSIAFMEFSL